MLEWAPKIDREVKAAPDEGAILVDGNEVGTAHIKMIEAIPAYQKLIDDSRTGGAR
ncbi:MAG: hypothetical protein Q7T63_06680 [Burkholderiaceae bacterium]|nr:hypothetical protein [Burkholderiaceae bacterium]MDO9088702.1 hypothetical protein [Burkholderiaceae bacterium]